MSRILHIIDRLAGGGPTRSMIALVKSQRENNIDHTHRIIALEEPVYPMALFLARQARAEVLIAPQERVLWQEIEAADIVQLHFHNNPTFYKLLRTPMPPLRLLVWLKIFGNTAPQIVTPELVAFADHCVATTSGTLRLPALRATVAKSLIYALADFSRLAGAEPEPHADFNVTYIGSLNYSKMHPDFIQMSAAAAIPTAQFHVGGAQPEALAAQVASVGQSAKFVFHGFVENIKPLLQISDVFGYPLREETYATSEKSLQEAMWLGIPPVVFPYGGIVDLVSDEQTGLIAHDAAQYTAALERLYRNPQLRHRLGRQAREYARRHFDGKSAAYQFAELYERMIQQPKRIHEWAQAGDDTPSGWFVSALGDAGTAFAASKAAADADDLLAVDSIIAAAPPLLANGEGGIQHYRSTYPEDPYLRYWSALALIGQQRHETARRELDAAQSLGLNTVYQRLFVRSALP